MDYVTSLISSILWILAPPTIILLLLRHFLPALGNPLWRGWCQLLAWLAVAPVRLVRFLVREALGRRRR